MTSDYLEIVKFSICRIRYPRDTPSTAMTNVKSKKKRNSLIVPCGYRDKTSTCLRKKKTIMHSLGCNRALAVHALTT